VVARPSGNNGSRVGRHHAPLDGLPPQEASLPPWSSKRTSGAQSGRRGHSLPPSTNDGGDVNADYGPYHVGACKRSGSSFAHVIDFFSLDDITFSLPPTLHHQRWHFNLPGGGFNDSFRNNGIIPPPQKFPQQKYCPCCVGQRHGPRAPNPLDHCLCGGRHRPWASNQSNGWASA
jgi:hypothetical protein